MPKHIFEIKKLSCSYDKKTPILKVKELNLPSGKIIVILGKSGMGKSTLLETLGLMNHTILNKSDTVLNFHTINEDTYSFKRIWKEEENIAEVRRKHFSFIFQDTNLMPNFTVYENIYLTQMIQGVESIKKTESFMDRVGLGKIGESKKAFELSGGERQRVAFVRAITPSFTVLFGDEPTGNLDEGNAKDLMDLLKSQIDTSKMAIIVSHNIDLALNYADMIIVLTKCEDEDCGEVRHENIFYKEANNKWNRKNRIPINDNMKELIKQIAGMK